MKYTVIFILIINLSTATLAQNTGIGTTDPLARLQINHRSSTTFGLAFLDSTNTGAGSIKFQTVGNLKFLSITATAGSYSKNHSLHIGSDSLTIASFMGTGSVTIGTSTEAGKLTVYNSSPTASAIVGAAHNVFPGAVPGGAGGSFTGSTTGLSAHSNTSGTGQAIYTTQFNDVTRINYYNGVTVYKIQGAGTVSTVATAPNGEKIILHCPETPEIYFQDYGEGKLVNGFCHIAIDPSFSHNITVNEKHPLRAFVQLRGDCNGVYVINETATGFDVRELNGGTSNASFHWTITCNRADEILPSGRLSKNADIRFEKMID